MTHHKHGHHQMHDLTTGQLAIAMIPAVVFTSGLTALMAAQAYKMIRLANAEGTRIEVEAK